MGGVTPKATILVVTWDGAGSFPPERTLIRALARRGHAVHVLAPDTLRERLEKDGARFLTIRSVPQYDSAGEMGDDLPWFLDNVWFGRGYADDVSSAIERLRPDLLLVDGALAFALLAAARSGLPTVVVWHTVYSLFMGGPFRDLMEARLGDINAGARALGVGPFASHRALLESSPLLLVSSYRAFEPAPEFPPQVLHVGPLRGSTNEGALWKRRHPDRPLVLVGLSTSYQAQAELLSKLAEALAALPVEAVITTGPAIAPGSIAGGSNTSVVSFAPHDAILPECDLLITHAGHGTVMAGLTHGVPMLCFPMGRDQPLVAARVAELGMGRVQSPLSSVAEIRASIEAALNDHEARTKCAAFAEAAAKHSGVDEAVAAIERLRADASTRVPR